MLVLNTFDQVYMTSRNDKWQEIVESNSQIVWQTVNRLLNNHADAADCFQETFICALEIAARQKVRCWSALLRKVATMRSLDKLRKRMSVSESIQSSCEDLNTLECQKLSPLELLEEKELAKKLRWALARLPQQQSEAFCLMHFEDMSYSDIASQMDLKVSTVNGLLHRGRMRLRELLEPVISGKE